ncbi:rod shape-determining protein MreC [Paraburkholderia dinghuensis]|uniref:Cell shape-determining protein MreC n=1 Tax=Paraburkholderia dinghuensis TaxID=2305225 RepID=A0A3N6MJL5_9BURK|nr:rod shape-determining protein MreC [Paraburkholderia dinghuensis]RQH03648.1 rod shape-determining protein MreC [Paraburkholderia dinghuensis]
MEYSPPPLFKQGPSALARLILFVALSLVLLISDARFKTLEVVRGVLGAGLYPLQRAALVPRDFFVGAADLAVTSATLRSDNTQLHARNLQLSQQANQAAILAAENAHLRALLQLSQHFGAQTTPAEIQYDTRDPFTQKVVIGRGSQQDIQNGAPVVSEDGVIGQVTRVFPMQSEVTLLTDKDQAVPVEIVRTGLRSVIYGTPQGALLDLRFVPISADVQAGDELVTSGLDGVYPQGLPVAKVLRVDKQADTAFARVVCAPVATVRGARQVLVLHYVSQVPPRPAELEPVSPDAKKKADAKKAADSKAQAAAAAQASGTAAAKSGTSAGTTTGTSPATADAKQKPSAAPPQPATKPDRAVPAKPAANPPPKSAQQRAAHAAAPENP